jgi:hypothetical protein
MMKSPQDPRTGRVSLAAVAKVAVLAVVLAGTGAALRAQAGAGTQPGASTPDGQRSTPPAPSVVFTPDDPRPTPGWTLTPTFVFSQASDSNITLAGQGTPTIADAVAALTPSVDLSFLGRTTSFNGGYSGSATRYYSVDQLDSFDQRLYANLAQQVGRRVQVFAQNSAGWLPATDTILLTGVPFGRVGSRIESLTAGATITITKSVETTAGYRFEWVDFNRDPVLGTQLLGGHTGGIYGDVRHRVTSRLSVGGSYDIRRAIVAGGLQQFNLLNVEGNFEYRLSPVLDISGGFGMARIAGSLPEVGSRVGPAFHGNATYKFQRILVSGGYLRSYVPSYGIGGTVQNQELTAGATVPIAFRDRLVVGGNVAWRRNDPLDLTLNRLTSRWLNAYGSYGFAPWLRVEGFYSRDTQDSHLGGVLRSRVGVQVVTFVPMRFK